MSLRADSERAQLRTMAALSAEAAQASSHEVFKRNERPQAMAIASRLLVSLARAAHPRLPYDRGVTMARLYLPCRGHRRASPCLASPLRSSTSTIALRHSDLARHSPTCQCEALLQLRPPPSDAKRASRSCPLQPPSPHGLLRPRSPLATLSQLVRSLRVRIRSSLPARMGHSPALHKRPCRTSRTSARPSPHRAEAGTVRRHRRL